MRSLGVAVQIAYLRFPGRPIARDEVPHPPLVAMIAAQLKAPVSTWELYATRDETRREHASAITRWLGLRPLDLHAHRSLSQWLLPIAMQTTQGMVLAQALLEELRRRKIVLPALGTLERLCAEVHTRAQRRIFKLLTAPLSEAQKTSLDGLLNVHKGGPISMLTWLRQPPGKPSAKMITAHLNRLQALRDIGLPADLGRDVNADRLLRMAREGAQSAVYQLKDHEPLRRHATLAAIALDTAATLTESPRVSRRPVGLSQTGAVCSRVGGLFSLFFQPPAGAAGGPLGWAMYSWFNPPAAPPTGQAWL